jgi:hypothetical protein
VEGHEIEGDGAVTKPPDDLEFVADAVRDFMVPTIRSRLGLGRTIATR